MRRGPGGRQGGFSLLEMLVVVAIAGALATFTVVKGAGVLGAGAVSAGTQTVHDLLNEARETAIASGTSVVVVVRRTGESPWRRLSTYSVSPDGTWVPSSKWRDLPSRAFIDPDYDPSTESWTQKPDSLGKGDAQSAAPAQAITDGGRTLRHGIDYYSLEFLPSGGLLCDANVALRVVRGHGPSAAPAADGGGTPVDWVKLVVERVTGQVKELRPGS